MSATKIRLKLTRSLALANVKRIENDLPPIESVRALARELELRWPKRYQATYITSRLHRANKTGRKVPKNLINDLLAVLLVDEKDILDVPPKEKGTVKIFSGKCNTLRTAIFLRLTLISLV